MKDQIIQLPRFASELKRRDDPRESSSSDMVFTGSGDSFSASLFAHYLSHGLALAADPSDLTMAPDPCDDKIVFITSVSGRTRANIILARRIKQIARERVAISADPSSPLARACDDTIRLPYNRTGSITPGTLSFTMSLLAVSSRTRSLPSLRSLKKTSERAGEQSQQLEFHPASNFLFLGSGIGHALAAYGAFKIQEVIGMHADYEQTEQVGHSKLFSIRKTDNILCLALGPDKKTIEASRILAENGFNAHLLSTYAQEPIVAGLEAALSIQQLALRLARRKGLREVAFLTDRNRLALSSRLIY